MEGNSLDSNPPTLRVDMIPGTPSPTSPSFDTSWKFRRHAFSPARKLEKFQTSYSPFRSVGLYPPTSSLHSRTKLRPDYGRQGILYFWKHWSLRKTLLLVFMACLVWWWRDSWMVSDKKYRGREAGLKIFKQRLQSEVTKDLQFFSAANPKIHYMGRWVPTPNRLRKDGLFPGIYFDLNITNTTSLLLSLRNAPLSSHKTSSIKTGLSAHHNNQARARPKLNHLSFHRSAKLDEAAPPVSLLARIDQEEYVLLPNSSGVVSVRSGDLDPSIYHQIRIILPTIDEHSNEVVQLEGIWLSKHGKLSRVAGSSFDARIEGEDSLGANENIGQEHSDGLATIMETGDRYGRQDLVANEKDDNTNITATDRKKVLEILTDSPGSLNGKNRHRRVGGVDGLLSGVMGWEYLLGEMYQVDHVAIGVDGMCLTQKCIRGTGSPAGLGDVFFRSGPPQSLYFDHLWMFDSYAPDLLILNIGSSDAASFAAHQPQYKKSMWELQSSFEEDYVSLIKSIRQLAYPKHPALLHSERIGSLPALTTPASIPIFVMRPLTGALEHASLGVVNRLRADGDSAVYWIDTSGWLILPSSGKSASQEPSPDFYLDDAVDPPRQRLTELGNQRVAIFLHGHVCRFLAAEGEKCPFLPPDVYAGAGFEPQEKKLEYVVEKSVERKLKQMFWDEDMEKDGKVRE